MTGRWSRCTPRRRPTASLAGGPPKVIPASTPFTVRDPLDVDRICFALHRAGVAGAMFHSRRGGSGVYAATARILLALPPGQAADVSCSSVGEGPLGHQWPDPRLAP